jgi:hypothetical protein
MRKKSRNFLTAIESAGIFFKLKEKVRHHVFIYLKNPIQQNQTKGNRKGAPSFFLSSHPYIIA